MPHMPFLVFRSVGRKEGKGVILFFVLYQMDKDPFRHPELLAAFREERGHSAGVSGDLFSEHLRQYLKMMQDPVSADVFSPQPEGDRIQSL